MPNKKPKEPEYPARFFVVPGLIMTALCSAIASSLPVNYAFEATVASFFGLIGMILVVVGIVRFIRHKIQSGDPI